MKRVLITGVTGQDGAYLSALLLEKGYKVWGGVRPFLKPDLSNLLELGIADEVEVTAIDLLDAKSLVTVLDWLQPDEVYHLAAQSSVSASFSEPVLTGDITALGTVRLLDAVRTVCPNARFYHASSSEMFGHAVERPQKETTSFHPRSPYAAAKVYAHNMTVNYRESYGLHASNGILFNHESPLRAERFVTRKVTLSAARISLGIQGELLLGNIDVFRDFGYAPEYVEAMWMMLQRDVPDDYVVATGTAHSVRDFVEEAFRQVGLDYREYVKVDRRLYRPADIDLVVGDASKARELLRWEPHTSFSEIVAVMVAADIERSEQGAPSNRSVTRANG